MITRRHFLPASLAIAMLPFERLTAADESAVSPRPDPALFQSGDFVWPKVPGAFVPYDAGSARSAAEDQARWEAERKRYIDALRARPDLDSTDRERIKVLSQMTYRDFLAVYEGNQTLGVPGAYSGSGFYVGHVGILDIDSNGKAWVIEAVLGAGVRRVVYDEWLNARPKQMVWLGRLRQLSPQARASIVPEATKYIGKPYDFWNFDLNDDSGFYCSKLVWLATFRSLHFAVDGVDRPKRVLWFSPKQLLYCKTVDRLHDPGPYAYQ